MTDSPTWRRCAACGSLSSTGELECPCGSVSWQAESDELPFGEETQKIDGWK